MCMWPTHMRVWVLYSLLQGVEVVGGKPIIYSGGSFVDDYAGDQHYRNDLSAVFLAHFAAPDAPAAAAGAAAAEGMAAAAEGSDTQQGRDQVQVRERQQHPAGHAAEPAASQPAAAATAGRDAGQPTDAPRLVLQSLHALPIAIKHSWRTEGGPYQEAGLCNPPYFSQVG